MQNLAAQQMKSSERSAEVLREEWIRDTPSYRGSVGAKNCALIQPFKRPFCTWIQSASRLSTLKRVPFGAVPRPVPLFEGVDLMCTPGRCKKRTPSVLTATVSGGWIIVDEAAEAI